MTTESQRSTARIIKEVCQELNDLVVRASQEGIATEFILDNVTDNNEFHQKIRPVIAVRL